MKEKVNQLFKDKLFLVMLVLGLLTIVSAAGVITIRRGNGAQEAPYLENQNPGIMAENQSQDTSKIAGAAEAEPKADSQTETQAPKMAQKSQSKESEGGDAAAAGSGQQAAKALVLNFSDSSKMNWPIQGNVVLDYNMDSTIYFPTLDQYKCNPGVVIQSDVSTPIYAPVNAKVVSVAFNEEIGNYVTLDLGNEYSAICGQLKEIQAVEGEYLEQGQLIGYVAEPTKYYSVEGTNVYFQLMHEGKTIDPVDYFN